MHRHVQAVIQTAVETFDLAAPIYEFGFATNAGPAGAAPPCDGTEIERLDQLARLPFPDGAARTVIAINTLEHVFDPRRAADELIRILAPGGMLLIASESDPLMPLSPDHYWRPTPRAMQRVLAGLEATLVGWQGAERFAHSLFGIGCKRPVAGTFVSGVNRFLDRFQHRLDRLAAEVSWSQRLKRLLLGWTRGPTERRQHRDYYQSRFTLHLPLGPQFKHQLLGPGPPEQKTGTRLDLG